MGIDVSLWRLLWIYFYAQYIMSSYAQIQWCCKAHFDILIFYFMIVYNDTLYDMVPYMGCFKVETRVQYPRYDNFKMQPSNSRSKWWGQSSKLLGPTSNRHTLRFAAFSLQVNWPWHSRSIVISEFDFETQGQAQLSGQKSMSKTIGPKPIPCTASFGVI